MNGTSGFLCPRSNVRSGYQVACLDLDQIAAAKLAVDGKIKQGTVSNSASRSRKKRIAQISFCVRGRLVPTIFPAFHAARPVRFWCGLIENLPLLLYVTWKWLIVLAIV